MLTSFRRLSKSKVGTAIIATFFVLILIGFAMSDIRNFGSGDIGFGLSSSTIAKVGDQRISDRELNDAVQRRLQQERQQNPDADYNTVARDFDRILAALIDQNALIAFASKHGFPLSKRLVDAEIAQIPETRGFNGQFSEQAYQGFLSRQRLTDRQVRQLITGGLIQRLLLGPVAVNPRVSVGMATPYASMLLEAREGEAAIIPIDMFKAGLNPTDADLQRYYAANRARYVIPEQRVVRFARIGSEQVANVAASDREIAAYYNSNQATYGAKQTRVLSQVVVPDQNAANAIAARAKGGASLSAAAAPAGANAAVSALGPQTREAYASVAGNNVAAAVFGAASGAVVGPLKSDFGWVVVKVDSIKTEGGKSLEQAKSEIAAKVTADKRKQAIEGIVDRLQNAVDDGSNFSEAAGQSKLEVITTPAVIANGTSRADPAYRLPQDLAPALKAAFEMAPNDPPEIVSLGEDKGYALVAPGDVTSAAPAPLASIRDKVLADWTEAEAATRARAAANAIAAKASKGTPLGKAAEETRAGLPAVRPLAARRIQIATSNAPVPPPMQALFSLEQGKSRMVVDQKSRVFFVVKVNKVVPGNALLQPGLISRMQNELREALSNDYATQFLAAIRADAEVRRNESAIVAAKQRLTASGS